MSRLDGLQLASLRSTWFEAVDNAVLYAAIGGLESVSLVLADLRPDAPQPVQTLVDAMSKDYRQKHFQVTWDDEAGRLDLAWGGASPASGAPEDPEGPEESTHIVQWRAKPRLEFFTEPDSKWTPWATFCEWDGEWVADAFFADYLRMNPDALAACQRESDKVHVGAPLVETSSSKPCTWRATRSSAPCGQLGTPRGSASAACPYHLCPSCRINIQYGTRGACRSCLSKREREEEPAEKEADPPPRG